jgi:hypothetical protein
VCRVSAVYATNSNFEREQQLFASAGPLRLELRRAVKDAQRLFHLCNDDDDDDGASLAVVEGAVLWSDTAATAPCRMGENDEAQTIVIVFAGDELCTADEICQLKAASTFSQQTNPGSSAVSCSTFSELLKPSSFVPR